MRRQITVTKADNDRDAYSILVDDSKNSGRIEVLGDSLFNGTDIPASIANAHDALESNEWDAAQAILEEDGYQVEIEDLDDDPDVDGPLS